MFKKEYFSAVKLPAFVLLVVSLFTNHAPIANIYGGDAMVQFFCTYGVAIETTLFYELFAFLFAVFFILRKDKPANRVWIPYAVALLLCVGKYFQ